VAEGVAGGWLHDPGSTHRGTHLSLHRFLVHMMTTEDSRARVA
jgi:hypothetical protein